jgi:hypothetical protein
MSDHIPDLTKMIGDTPISDSTPHNVADLGMLCRWLERQFNAANERIKNLESALCTVENIDKVNAYQDLESANERIKRVEEAGDAVEERLGCGCGCGGPCRACRSASENWFKAKEAKL